MSYLDVEHLLGLRGSDTWSGDGNEGTVVAKTLIGRVIAHHNSALEDIPDVYKAFAAELQPADIVLTFNYDTLLERALDAIGKPYRLFATRYSKVERGAGTLMEDQEVSILKLHGSIDWFDRETLADWRVDVDALDLVPVVDGPAFEDEPLKNIYRARNLSEAYAEGRLFKATPKLLAPSAIKFAYAPTLTNFFRGLGTAGVLNFGMAIVGYSLPKHDSYALQILHTLVQNYQTQYWERPAFSRAKTPLVVVDRFSAAAHEVKFRSRYQFVNWERATLIGDGFGPSAIDAIFADPVS